MSQSNLSIIKFQEFLALHLGWGCMTFDFTTQMYSNNLLFMSMNVLFMSRECKGHQMYSKMLAKICKKEF